MNQLQDKIDEAVNSFIASVVDKTGQQPTEQAVQAVKAKITSSISSSAANFARRAEVIRNIEEDLAERRAAVLADARHNKVLFIHDRALQKSTTEVIESKWDKRSGREISLYELNQSVFGGRTFAFAYEIDEEGKLLMEVAVAHCRSDEAYCEVIGMEQSLQYFIDGRTIVIPVTHERLGPGKLAMMSTEFNQKYHQ